MTQCPFTSGENWGGTGANCACEWETDDEDNVKVIHCAWGNCSTPNENSCVSPSKCDGVYHHQIPDPEALCKIILPISLISFSVIENDGINNVTWSTASELNNKYFVISQSENGEDWTELTQLSGSGTSSQKIDYKFYHYNPKKIINYYLLTQVNYDGKSASFGPISVDNRVEKRKLIKRVNTFGQSVDENYRGITIYYYSDGSVEKYWQ